MDTYLAIDIGASSGRHILGRFDGKRLVTEEIYRFDNNLKSENGHLFWDVENLFSHVIPSLQKYPEQNILFWVQISSRSG